VCDPAAPKFEPLDIQLGDIGKQSRSVLEVGDDYLPELPFVTTELQTSILLNYSLADLGESSTSGVTHLFSIGESHSQGWLTERIGDQIPASIVPAALPLLGIGLALFGLFARRRGETWRIIDSEE
jgi:hypothetical protein